MRIKKLQAVQPTIWRPKVIGVAVVFFSVTILSEVFPSLPQQQAKEVKLQRIYEKNSKRCCASRQKVPDKKIETLAKQLEDMKNFEEMLTQIMKNKKELAY